MRTANMICPRELWNLALCEDRSIFDGIRKKRSEIKVYEVEPSYEEIESVVKYGSLHAPIRPKDAMLQNFVMDLHFSKMPASVVSDIESKTAGNILCLHLFFATDEKDAMFCDITCTYFTGSEIKSLNIGTVVFFADQRAGNFSIAPWSINDDTLDVETMENLVNFIADFWNGLQYRFRYSDKALMIRAEELLSKEADE